MVRKPYIGVIYRATNTVNGTIYIGKSLMGLDKRRKTHLSAARNGKMWPFCCALRKHGKEAFVWDVLYMSDDNDDLSVAETLFIAEAKSSGTRIYNATEGGDGARRKKSESEIARMKERGVSEAFLKAAKESWTDERRAETAKRMRERDTTGLGEKIRAAKIGKPRPQEVVERIAAANRGKKLPGWTPERRAKMEAAWARGCAKPSDETRAKMSEKAKARSSEAKERARLKEISALGRITRWGE